MAYNHAAIPVIDQKMSEAFYTSLGFSRLREWKKPAENLEAQVLVKEGFILELVYSPSNAFSDPPTIVESSHIGVNVTNLEKTLSELVLQGTPILKQITKGVSVREFAFVADPSGNVVELVVER